MDINALAQTLLAILLPPLVALGIEYLRRRIGIERLQRLQQEFNAKQEWALLAVRYAEQVYKDGGGADKYNAACEWLSTHAETKGIKLSILEIEGLIESSVQIIKAGIWAIPAEGVIEVKA